MDSNSNPAIEADKGLQIKESMLSLTGHGHVRCAFVGWVLAVSQRNNIDPSIALKGISFTENYLQAPANYIDWDSFCTLIENISTQYSVMEYDTLWQYLVTHPDFRAYSLIVRSKNHIKSLCGWLLQKIIPRMLPVSGTLLSETDTSLNIQMVVDSGLNNCPALFQFIKALLVGLAAETRHWQCVVALKDNKYGVEFDLTLQKQRGLAGFISHFFSPSRLPHRVLDELMKKDERLLDKSLQLAIATQKVLQAKNKVTGFEMQHQVIEKTLMDIIWVSDLTGQVVYVSPAIKPMFGYEIKEAMQMNLVDFLCEHQAQSFNSLLSGDIYAEMVEASGRVRPEYSNVVEVMARRKDGSEFWCEIHRGFQFDEAGKPQGMAGITRDISERKQTEIEKSLLERELAHSRHMESIGQLAGGIAHDFNNMLTTVLGFSDLAKGNLGPDHAVLPYLKEISRAGSRASDLVKQLLAYSKQEPMEPRPFNLTDLVEQLNPMLSQLVSENIDLTIDVQPVPMILGDPTELERVLINLCLNAIDAMPDGGRLYISTREYLLSADDSRVTKAGTDSFACISVSDTGHGIDPGIQERVLEPFFTTKPFGQGTGLGLAVTYSIVQQHHGFLDLVSHPNRGTTIKVFLPRTLINKPEPVAIDQQTEGDGSGTILVVEDQEQVRRLIVQILETAGYDVLEASDGNDAVTTYTAFADDIDLIVMDIVMPKMGGRDSMDLIRQVNPDAEVLFMTGYSDGDPRTDFAMNVGYQVLRKPFSSVDVIQRVGQILRSSETSQI
ncbi:MAG: response regulator [Pseudomonadales bacterium]|nr:response regulator [Pseudomonadales bacterium]